MVSLSRVVVYRTGDVSNLFEVAKLNNISVSDSLSIENEEFLLVTGESEAKLKIIGTEYETGEYRRDRSED